MRTSNLIKAFLLLFVFGLLLVGCNKKEDYVNFKVNPEFKNYISGFTSGVVSSVSPIQVQLVEPFEGKIEANKAVDEKYFNISPSVAGKTIWSDQNTIQFVPEKPLNSDEVYWIEFDLGKVRQVPKEFKTLKFPVKVIKQAIGFSADGLLTYSSENTNYYQFKAKVLTADVIEEEELNKAFTFKLGGKDQQPKWMNEGNNKYELILDSIERTDMEKTLKINYRVYPYGERTKEDFSQKIPKKDVFEVVFSKINQHPEQAVVLYFSDPLDVNQNLDGLIELGGKQLRTTIKGNELRIFPQTKLEGVYNLTINPAVENFEGKVLGEYYQEKVEFSAIEPSVKLVSRGSILPSSNSMTIPFEAVNLKAVDVRIIKVFEDNIRQFFQINDYDGTRELKRVGKLIRKKTIYLNEGRPLDLSQWNRFNLDISDFIKVEQGAIYRVEIGFRKYQSVYPCNSELEEDVEDIDEKDWDDFGDSETEDWSYSGDWNTDYYSSYWFSGYRYSMKNNPCSYSYYTDKSVSKNIFASDIGIVAKRGTNKETVVFITDIVTAQPIGGAEVQFFDYQQQLLAKTNTDKNGMAKTLPLKSEPFFVMATSKGEKGYLRLGNSNSLSLSRFDIDGTSIKDGIKGFIYGERGVWRPGDTLFVSFILEDKDQLIPANHPVIFELYNAKGQLVNRRVSTNGINGMYNFTTPTDMDAPTGNWMATVDVGGARFTKNLKVETIKPNRLKINLKFKEDLIRATSNVAQGNLTSNWLHGAPAKNLKTDISVRFSKMATNFKDHTDYKFDDPSKSFYDDGEIFLTSRLDEQGKLSFNKELRVEDQAPGMLRAVFTTRVFEEGGNFSSDQTAIQFSPYHSYVGIKSPLTDKYGALETDKEHHFSILSIDEKGSIAPNRKVKVELFKIEWNWWWESDEDRVANYVNNSDVKPYASEILTTNAKGKAETSTKVNKYDWGQYFIKITDLESGHSAGVLEYFDWPSWMSRAGRDTPDNANMLTFSSDKEEYVVGEKAKLSFPSSKESRALVSIENGKKVIDAFWINGNEGETNFNLPIVSEFAPNIYVHITLLQPHKYTENDAPIRMYGIAPISVVNPATKLHPEIKMPKELTPNSKFTIEVKEMDKKDMTYTIAVVDEGLLDLTRFQTPNPWNHFYSREALGVKTWDLFDNVIGAYGAKVENILTIGGDDKINPGDEKPIRFKPMVRFIGPFSLKGGKTARHEIDVPNYIGSVRTMVVAGENGAYGSAEETTPVRTPLMILSTLPRVLGPKEVVKLPVNVFAMDKKVKNVTLQVKTNKYLKIVGQNTKQIHFDSMGDQVVYFDVEVGTLTGAAKVDVIATSGNEKSTETIDLEVRQPNLPATVFKEASVAGNASWEGDIALHGMENSNTLKLELSTIPAINLEKRLQYLTTYPHGCIEQKTSGVFPQLFLASLMEIDENLKKRIDDNINSVINRLIKHQQNDGGFSFWENGAYSDDWGSTYAGHFMIEAEKKGYALPFGLKKKWIDFQKMMAKKWTNTSNIGYQSPDLVQAYRLYTLALAGEPVLSEMNKLRTRKNLSIQASWRLAAAYQIIGKGEIAKEIVQGKSTAVKPYTELSNTYGNDVRDKAMIVEALTLMNDKTKASILVKELSEKLSEDSWMSTQTTAYTLLAISKFTENNQPKDGMKLQYIYEGKTYSVNSHKAIELIDLPIKNNQSNASIKVNNQNDGYLFTRLVATGTPLPGNEIVQSNNLNLEVVYKGVDGKPINPSELVQGSDFYVEVTVSNPGIRGDYQGLALSQIFPSGWEITNHRMDIDFDDEEEDNSSFTYQDIRDDRVYTHFDLAKNTSKTIRIDLHASYKGEFYLSGVTIEAMYDNTISASSKGNKVVVE